MKGFFQSLLGSLTAFIILAVGSIVAFIVLIGALASLSEQPLVQVESGSVLVLDLNTTIMDAPPIADIGAVVQEAMSGQPQPVTYLLKVIDAIEYAQTDDDVSALLIHGNLLQNGYGSGLAAISEIRQAIEFFKTSGKPVYAYVVAPSQKDYYLASVADEVWVNPFGMISLNGLAANGAFLGSALEKYGIGVQTTRVGAYKSAVEMFTRTKMSDADREQKTVLLNDLWGTLLTEISTSRAITKQDIVKLSSNDAFFTASDAQAANLVDRVGYLDELIDHLGSTYHYAASDETFQQIGLIDYSAARTLESDTTAKDGERIAIVYAEGQIIDGGKFPGFIGGDWLAEELRRLRKDKDVKAVVLRVNSPGGSAVASEIIQRETRLLAEQKPLIVSMGSYAASGGYWISAYADSIYAQPYTITGSIGVFGMVFNIEEAAANFAVSFDGVKTSPFADIYTASRPRTEDEMALIQQFTDEIYDAFIDKVAEGRELEIAKVRELAQGRVWSGVSAQNLALVDSMGGLNAAINDAAAKSNLESYMIEQVPAPSNFGETLAMMLEEAGAPPVAKVSSPLSKIAAQADELTSQLRGLNDPRSVYTRMPYGLEGL
ncbi:MULTISPECIES: signal peptide peptidase SppA [unclassified Lentimonas]|uniref:signal peptide peptidase SppA n=1 Tax=unclassified Lentimonas TaxID=2630993 RepID=UPI0013897CEF|nr:MULTISPECIES: signal peptide peptidase SppA [unclassified Lentimonas]